MPPMMLSPVLVPPSAMVRAVLVPASVTAPVLAKLIAPVPDDSTKVTPEASVNRPTVGAVAVAGIAQGGAVADHQIGGGIGRCADAAGHAAVGQLADAQHAAEDGGDAGVVAVVVGQHPGAGARLGER